MKASKKRVVLVAATKDSNYDQWGRFTPLDEESYPVLIETEDRIYWRVYVRSRIIIYEVLYKLTKVRDHWYCVATELKFYDFDKMCEHVDKNDNNKQLPIIAKQ